MVAHNTPPLFSASSRRADPWWILDVAGELDLATAPQLRDHLIELIEAITDHDQPPSLILDMTKVEFCDASGLRVLVAAHRWIGQRGGRLRLVCPEGQLLRILRVTQLTHLLPVHPILDDALADHGARDHPPGHTGHCTPCPTARRYQPG
jgi:anti-sigma B factor antagonist